MANTTAKRKSKLSTRRRRKAPTGSKRGGTALAAAKQLLAAIRTGNRAQAERRLRHDFSFVDAAGRVHSRRGALGAMAATPRGAGTQVKVRNHGRIAVVTGHYGAAKAGERVFVLDVWVKGDDGWQTLIRHDNVLATTNAPTAHASGTARPKDAPPPRCANPLEAVPYKAKSQAERAIIAAFQALERAVTRNDPDAWAPHVADEFVVTRTRQHPTDKAARMAFMATQQAINAETFVAAVVKLRFWVFGDAAIMRADHAMPGNRRPPYRATRLWIRRDGQWQMALSQQTTIQP